MLQLESVVLNLAGFTLCADWSISTGARVAVIGASGAGKSSLLSAIAGFLNPEKGRILWDGQAISMKNGALRRVSILFQDQNLFPHLSLQHNVLLGLTAGRRPSAQQIQQADAALDRVGLAGMGTRRPPQVSGGQMARAALARVLLQKRPLLLLDEPFAALDSALRLEMLALVHEVASETGATALLVSHDLRDAKQFATHVVQVKNGRADAPVAAAEYFIANPF